MDLQVSKIRDFGMIFKVGDDTVRNISPSASPSGSGLGAVVLSALDGYIK
ncbi:hypothetical protein JCM39068_40540 [Desulfocastanea catecholica]